jgi:hypothetical protein
MTRSSLRLQRTSHHNTMANIHGPKRTIRLVIPPDDRGIGVLAIRIRDKITHYTFREIPCEIGGRGFAIHRLGVGQRYDVRIGSPADTSCECLGYLAHGHCKHIEGLNAILKSHLLNKPLDERS